MITNEFSQLDLIGHDHEFALMMLLRFAQRSCVEDCW